MLVFRFGPAALMVLVFGNNLALGQPAASQNKVVKAQLRLMQNIPGIMRAEQVPLENYAYFRLTQATMIKSRVVLESALRDPKVAKIAPADRLEVLEKTIEVDGATSSELLEISAQLADPADSATVVNAVVKAYLENVVEADHQPRIQRLDRLKKLYDRYQKELKTKRASLRALSNSGPELLQVQQSLVLQDLTENHRDLRQARLQRETMEAHLAKAEAEKVQAEEKVHQIEQAISEHKLREDVLKTEEKELLVAYEKLKGTIIDLEGEKADIALLEETARKIGLEVEALDVELQAPRRISVWTPADPGPPKK